MAQMASLHVGKSDPEHLWLPMPGGVRQSDLESGEAEVLGSCRRGRCKDQCHCMGQRMIQPALHYTMLPISP